jgi:hypothetical protein
MASQNDFLLPNETIHRKIFVIRGKKVLIDRHLAELYGVSTKRLNEQLKRNIKRFPPDFMFQLTQPELDNLKSQIATSSWGGARHLPNVFTEHGVVMLASILNSDTAINVSIQIVRVFNQLREMISNHEELRIKIEELEKEYDARFDRVDMHVQSVFQAFKEIKKLLKTPSNKKKKIGFIQ